MDSGVRVVTERMDSVRSAALGFWIGTGSAAEDDSRAGLSHLIEHMLFRGTERYGSLEIDQLFDTMGAELNAGTGKETTSVYARILDVHVPEALDVIGDMVWRPRFAADDLANEREIVLEEIAMYEDDPQDKVFDVLGEAVFHGHPLGRAIIGRADVVASTPPDGLAAFHAERYVPDNVVVAAAGSVDHDAFVELVRAVEVERRGVPAPREYEPPVVTPATVRFLRKDTEQVHVCLGGPGMARDDERRYALRVLDAILGGTSSSRLFQEVREKRGLAYSVYSFQSLFAATGQVGLYLGTRPDNLAPALRVVGEELARLREDAPTEDELARARENVKGRVVLGLESTLARMNRLGSSLLAGLPLLSVDEIVERLDAVTRDDVGELARELYAPEMLSAAGVGGDEAAFRAALEPVSPELAAA
ncbi:MAG TPA: pitrilysin family protein [Solirubrobacteraceae bacterium]|nr:pitrilysin family protein [Solirubrobacteraceae bacterium]